MADEQPIIPDLPPAPLRSEPEEVFSEKASAFVGAMNPWGQIVNAVGAWIQNTVDNLADYLGLTEQARDDALSAAGQSGNHAQESEQWAQQANAFAQVAATNANFLGNWDELSGAVTVPASVYWQGAYWQLLRDLPNVAASEPGQTDDWAGTQTEIIAWEPVSGNVTLASNRHYGVNFSSGQVLTLPASPANNDIITLYKRSGNSNGAVLARNGNTIMGLAQDMTIDGDITGLQLIFTGSDWRITR